MKLKTVELDGVTYGAIADGKPVYISDDGKETAFDAPGTIQTISRLNAEAKSHRERAEKAEGSLKGFDGIEDPKAALAALTTVQNLDHKKLVDAGEVEKVKAAAIEAVEAKYKPIVEERALFESQLRAEKIGGSFARSAFIGEKLAVPAAMVEKTFGEHFTIEGGKIVAKDANGNQIYSASRPGEPANFDEALSALVDQSPFRDSIMKAKAAEGGDVKTANGAGGQKTIKRAEFDKMSQPDRIASLGDGAKVVD